MPLYIFVFAIDLPVLYISVLRSEFGHVYLLTTLVYLLKLVYVNSCIVCLSHGPKPFLFCPLYVFIHFVFYGTLCLRFG